MPVDEIGPPVEVARARDLARANTLARRCRPGRQRASRIRTLGPAEVFGEPVGPSEQLGTGQAGHRRYHTTVVAPLPPDADRLAAVRAALPALEAGIYLNTGSVGPLPAETAAAMDEISAWELTTGRAHPDYFDEMLQRMAEARAAVAAILVADAADIALTHSTSDGMNIGIMAIDWQAGDRVVTTSHEHPGGTGAAVRAARPGRHRARFVDLGDGDGPRRDPGGVRCRARRAHPARRVSHVLWTTGAVLPIAGIAEIAAARGAIVVVDAAQSAGAIPVDLGGDRRGCLALPAQKWLLGPEGMGAVAVAPGVGDRLPPASAGFAFETIDRNGNAVRWHRRRRSSRRTSTGRRWSGIARDRLAGMSVGLPWVFERGRAMAAPAADRLAAIPGVELLTPRRSHGHARLVPDRRLDGGGGARGAERPDLRDRPDRPGHRRAADQCGVLEHRGGAGPAVEAVALLAGHTPETLPPRRHLAVLGEAMSRRSGGPEPGPVAAERRSRSAGASSATRRARRAGGR